jgi:hypothetical protein
MLRKTFLAMSIAAAALGTSVARAETYIVMTPGDSNVVTTADGRIVQAMPEPREGYRWMPGYWQSEGDHQVWIEGHWIPDANAYVRDREHEEHHSWRRHDRDDDD